MALFPLPREHSARQRQRRIRLLRARVLHRTGAPGHQRSTFAFNSAVVIFGCLLLLFSIYSIVTHALTLVSRPQVLLYLLGVVLTVFNLWAKRARTGGWRLCVVLGRLLLRMDMYLHSMEFSKCSASDVHGRVRVCCYLFFLFLIICLFVFRYLFVILTAPAEYSMYYAVSLFTRSSVVLYVSLLAFLPNHVPCVL